MKISKTIYPICICAILASCSDVSLDEIGLSQAVVAGYIYSNETLDSLRIFESNSYTGDTIFRTIDNLSVEIISEGNSVQLISNGDGYYNHPELIIRAGTRYQLSFEWNGEQIMGAFKRYHK